MLIVFFVSQLMPKILKIATKLEHTLEGRILRGRVLRACSTGIKPLRSHSPILEGVSISTDRGKAADKRSIYLGFLFCMDYVYITFYFDPRS